jgi:hypothetical protein
MYNSTSYRTETITHDRLDRMLQGRGRLRTSNVYTLLVVNILSGNDKG